MCNFLQFSAFEVELKFLLVELFSWLQDADSQESSLRAEALKFLRKGGIFLFAVPKGDTPSAEAQISNPEAFRFKRKQVRA